jgi:O-acetyl-ADP-ribose deacetylase (regulator of RNase III)
VRITTELGDITQVEADAIVNAANSSLLGGGGVDGAIHAAAGPQLLEACQELRRTRLPGGLPVGDAVATPGFRLPARWVIHTVGPNRHAGQTDPALLGSCFARSLDVATGLGAQSVAFPAVSAGVYGWEPDDVAAIAVQSVRGWAPPRPDDAAADAPGAHDGAGGVEHVRFVLFSERLLEAFEAALAS